MSSAALQNITIHTGDSARIDVNFVDCAGVPVDITGATLTYSISEELHQTPLVTRISPSGVVIAENGESAAILLAPSHTNYADKRYFHELVLTDTDGNVLTVFTGVAVFSLSQITSCEALQARVDTDLFVPGASSYLFDFSSAQNSMYIALL